ncbi:MAG: PPC domain-containing DNA-binding protein [Candidatus Hodarchaeales archaeon]|jgi:predicted DNA-binding protein with PD1-like motif
MEYIKQKPQYSFLIRLLKGEDLLLSLQKFCAKFTDISAGSIKGIGAVSQVKYGFFDGEKYLENVLEENLEVLSIIGNIAEGQIVHLHGIFGKADGTCIGGHILPGCIISVTCELTVTVFEPKIIRKLDPETNLKLLSLPEKM